MLIKTQRPRSFGEVVGQDLPKRVLMAIAKRPQSAPRSIILHGGFGTGKTTSARIFARAVNCSSRTGDACNVCSSCLAVTENSPLYQELDSAVVGNVERMREMRDQFSYTVQDGFRVIVVDEAHLNSKQAQSVLLKILEEAPKGIFYMFCSTDISGILPTIKSRSLSLEFESLKDDEIRDLVTLVAAKESIGVSPATKERIVRRVAGHARDALQQLEFIKLVGEEEYLLKNIVLDDCFTQMVQAMELGQKDVAKNIVTAIVSEPSAIIRQDFERFIKRAADECFVGQKVQSTQKEMVFHYLRYQRLLQTSTEWYIFLISLTHFWEKKEVTTGGRFSKN